MNKLIICIAFTTINAIANITLLDYTEIDKEIQTATFAVTTNYDNIERFKQLNSVIITEMESVCLK